MPRTLTPRNKRERVAAAAWEFLDICKKKKNYDLVTVRRIVTGCETGIHESRDSRRQGEAAVDEMAALVASQEYVAIQCRRGCDGKCLGCQRIYLSRLFAGYHDNHTHLLQTPIARPDKREKERAFESNSTAAARQGCMIRVSNALS